MSQPRPALRRAADAEVHPALVVVTDNTGPVIDLRDDSQSERTTEAGPAAEVLQDTTETEKKAKSKKNKKNKKNKAGSKAGKRKSTSSSNAVAGADVPGPLLLSSPRRFRGAGRATSDALVTSGKKQATLKAQIPRPLRTELREAAKASGVSTDTLLAEILNAWFIDPDRW